MKKNNAILVGFTIPSDEANKIFKLDESPAIQTHKFAWSLARSIKSAGFDLFLISAAPIQNFPAGKKIFFLPKAFFEDKTIGNYIFFINILILKHITRLISIFITGFIEIFKKDINCIFIHGVHSPFIIFGFACRLFKKKVIVILTDPPGVILPSDGFFSSILKKIDASILKFLLGKMSGVITLSKFLSLNYAPNIPSLTFPGIVNKDFLNEIGSLKFNYKPNTSYTIAYAGGLNKAYGLDALVEAVQKYTATPIILKLYGRGDQEDNIISASKKNKNIIYKGFLNQRLLIDELMKADLLINPRPSNGNISTESFPSKLIEYLALGKPVLTTKIKSIPDEYLDLFYYIEDESPKGIAIDIDRIANLDKNEISCRSLKSQNFIISNATEEKIGEKIKNFLDSINQP